MSLSTQQKKKKYLYFFYCDLDLLSRSEPPRSERVIRGFSDAQDLYNKRTLVNRSLLISDKL